MRPNFLFGVAAVLAVSLCPRATSMDRTDAPPIVIPVHQRSLIAITESERCRSYLPVECDLSAPVSESYKKSVEYSQQALVQHISRAEATALMQKAIECDPKNPYFYNQRADFLIANKQPQEALTTLNQGIEAMPGAAELYENRVKVLLALNDPKLALSNANALVTYKPDSKNFCLRADVEEKMHDKGAEEKDLVSAITAAAKVGEDAMDEVDRLEALTGKKVQRPVIDTTKSETMVQSIVALAKSEKTFDPSFIEKQFGISLYEIPINGKTNFHTGEFRLRPSNKNFSEVTLNTNDAERDFGLSLEFDNNNCFITEAQIDKAFGKPETTDDEPPNWASYKIKDRSIGCEYYRHGFKLLKQIYFGKERNNANACRTNN